jgi:hypothetical protein
MRTVASVGAISLITMRGDENNWNIAVGIS